jgi:poly(3-hydroxyalkanoate) synthetase
MFVHSNATDRRRGEHAMPDREPETDWTPPDRPAIGSPLDLFQIASDSFFTFAAQMVPKAAAQPFGFASANTIRLDLPTLRLRDFSAEHASGTPVLIDAPFTLHTATVADFAPGHSLVAALRDHGIDSLFLTDWKSATPDMAGFGIDTYLADLNVAVDDLGGHVDLIGLCQGGWMALIYAARFPGKVRKLVLAGAPVDIAAGSGAFRALADLVPPALVDSVIATGHGCLSGRQMLAVWNPVPPTNAQIAETLQIDGSVPDVMIARFRLWHEAVVDLPGRYYRQALDWIFRENRLVSGTFVALGRPVDLSAVTVPLYVAFAESDAIVAPEQARGVIDRVATPAPAKVVEAVGGDHNSLFLGARNVATLWPRIARWLTGGPCGTTDRKRGWG